MTPEYFPEPVPLNADSIEAAETTKSLLRSRIRRCRLLAIKLQEYYKDNLVGEQFERFADQCEQRMQLIDSKLEEGEEIRLRIAMKKAYSELINPLIYLDSFVSEENAADVIHAANVDIERKHIVSLFFEKCDDQDNAKREAWHQQQASET